MSFRLRVNKRSVIPSTFPTLQPFQKSGVESWSSFLSSKFDTKSSWDTWNIPVNCRWILVELSGVDISGQSYDQFTICSALRRPFRPMSLKHSTKPIPSITDIPYILAYFGYSFLYAISSGKNVGIDTHHPITNVEKSDGKPRNPGVPLGCPCGAMDFAISSSGKGRDTPGRT